MSKDKKDGINISGNVEGGNVNIGSEQTVHGDLTINYGVLSNAPDGSPQAELAALLKELESALQQVPAEQAGDVELVKEEADAIAAEVAKLDPNPRRLEIKAEGLKKAAENLLTVAPIVGKIVAKVLTLG